MTNPEKAPDIAEPSEAEVEAVARIIAPGSWAVMDNYLRMAQREYAGKSVGWPTDQFKDKASMATARAAIRALDEVRRG
jgi:hypothetical protein